MHERPPARASGTAEVAPDDVDAVTDAVMTASRLLMGVSAQSLAAVDEAITLPQFRLLVVLESHGPLKLTGLADELGVNPSTATRMVDRLVGAGLLSREANPASRRELVVRLTDAGTTVVRGVLQYRRELITEIVGRMPESTRRGLVRALSAFTEAGGEPAVDHEREGTLWL